MANGSKWLVNKHKIIMVNRDLATRIGMNEAIVLEQLHYWLGRDDVGVWYQGEKYIYNTYKEWREGKKDENGKLIQEPNFPFWSEKTIQRTFLKLEEMGLVISINLGKSAWDQKKYYRIDYEKLELLDDDQDNLS